MQVFAIPTDSDGRKYSTTEFKNPLIIIGLEDLGEAFKDIGKNIYQIDTVLNGTGGFLHIFLGGGLIDKKTKNLHPFKLDIEESVYYNMKGNITLVLSKDSTSGKIEFDFFDADTQTWSGETFEGDADHILKLINQI